MKRRYFLERSERRGKILLLGILMMGIAARSYYLWAISSYPDFAVPFAGSDSAVNHELARRIAAGDILLGSDVYYYSSALYKYFLGGLYALFGDSFWTARIANVVLGSGTTILTYLFSKKLFSKDSIALFAACGVALYGPFIVFDTSMYKTSLELFLLTLSLLMLVIAKDRAKKRYWVLTGLVMGLTYATHPQIAVFIVFTCIYLLVGRSETVKQENLTYVKSLPQRLLMGGLLAGGLITALLPFALRNYYVSHDLTVSSTVDGIHMYIGNHKGAWGGYSLVDGVRPNVAGHFFDARRVAEKETERSLSASEVSHFWKKKALAFVMHEPTDFLRLLRNKVQLLFNFYEVVNNGNYQYLTSHSPFLARLPNISLLLPLGMAGLILSLREFRRFWMVHLFFLSYLFALLMTFVSWRYRLPLVLVLWPAAGYLLSEVSALVRRKQILLPALAAAFCIYFLILGNTHSVRQFQRDKDMKRAEFRMEASRKEGEILHELNRKHQATPAERSALWLQLALLRYEIFDAEGAVQILHRALIDDPGNAQLQETMRLMQEQPVNMEIDNSET